MADFEGENKVFGGVEFDNSTVASVQENVGETTFKKVESTELPTKPSIWTKFKSFLFKEIDLLAPVDLTAPIVVELTPYQQKVEDEINEFLHQEVSFKGFFGLFGKK